jgi:hypothetical protein
MNTRGADVRGAAVPFASKLNVRSEAGDPLDRAAQHTLDLLHRTAIAAEANNQRALEVADKDEPAIRSQAAHPGRGPTDRGQYRQAAGTPAPWGNEGLLPICAVGVDWGVHGLPKPRPQRPGRGFFLSIAGACRRKIL